MIVPGGRKVERRNVRVHRSTRLDPEDVAIVGGIPVTSPARTLIDLSGRITVDELATCLDTALRRRQATIDAINAMITATQEKVIPAPGRHGMVYVDTVIVAHSNEAEWQKFKADHTNEAILDRIVVVRVPYDLRLSEEVKIYEKFLRRSKFDAT